jgi:hypothetical protein
VSADPPGECFRYCDAAPASLAELWSDFRAAWRTFKAAGSPQRAKADRDACLAICRACPSQLYDVHFGSHALARCQGCRCFVALKSKMATEHCPRSHWPGDPPYVEPQCGTC